MRLSISNIAWDPAEEAVVSKLMSSLGVVGVEIAPTKVWPSPLEATDADIVAYRRFWKDQGIEISSLQALLFARPDLALFKDDQTRHETLAYLKGMIGLADRLGASVLVFGSPVNRQLGDKTPEEAESIALEFFFNLACVAADHDTVLCIEPNPPLYGCDFITTSTEGADLVAKVGHPGFGLHLDSACMTLSGEDIAPALRRALPQLHHFHISEPQLAPLGSGGVEHTLFSRILSDGGYRHWKAVEMRATRDGKNIENVRRALELAFPLYR